MHQHQNFSTIYKLFEILLYVNLTLDAGAYVNAYRVLTNYPEKFAKIVLHLGDFHFMKESFTILGTLVKGSGLKTLFSKPVCVQRVVLMVFSLAPIIIVAGLCIVS